MVIACQLLLLLACGGVGSGGTCEKPIAASDAIAAAEEFVRANGYTMHDPDRDRVVRQFTEAGSLDEILARRHGVLHETAFGHSKRGENWLVIFAFSEGRSAQGRNTGRAVLVDECGESVKLEHEEVFLDTTNVVMDD